MQMRLELIPLPVSDVDRAIAFYADKLRFKKDVDVRPSEQLRACRSNQKPVAEKYPEILTQQSENVYFSGRRPNARPRLGWRSRNLPPSSATNPLPPARKR